jgi:hypothetical protein
MSSTSKGKTFENFCADQLKQMGHHIMFKSIRVRFGAIDFGCNCQVCCDLFKTDKKKVPKWDIVSVKRLNATEVQWFFTQCKSTRIYGKEREKYVEWLRTYGFKGINCLLAIKTKEGRKTAILWDRIT